MPHKKMKSKEFVKKVYVSELEGSNQRGRPLGRWRDKVKEYMCDRGDNRGGGLEQARMDCLDRERWRLLMIMECTTVRPPTQPAQLPSCTPL